MTDHCFERWAATNVCARRIVFGLIVLLCLDWASVVVMTLLAVALRDLSLVGPIVQLLLACATFHALLAVALNGWVRIDVLERIVLQAVDADESPV